MAIVKTSEGQIDVVYDEEGEALECIAFRSLRCARCGQKIDADADEVFVICDACGYGTPRMISRKTEGPAS